MPADQNLHPWISVAAVAWGLLDCFFGYRIFRVSVVMLGAVAGVGVVDAAARVMGWPSGAG